MAISMYYLFNLKEISFEINRIRKYVKDWFFDLMNKWSFVITKWSTKLQFWRYYTILHKYNLFRYLLTNFNPKPSRLIAPNNFRPSMYGQNCKFLTSFSKSHIVRKIPFAHSHHITRNYKYRFYFHYASVAKILEWRKVWKSGSARSNFFPISFNCFEKLHKE